MSIQFLEKGKGGSGTLTRGDTAELWTFINDIRGLVYNVGQQLKQIFITRRHLDVEVKSKGQIVTIANRLTNELILSHLKQRYPYIPILSEEGPSEEQTNRPGSNIESSIDSHSGSTPVARGVGGSEDSVQAASQAQGGSTVTLLWVVDPLDGTTNFAMHNAFWNISVSLMDIDTGQVLVGVVYAPMYEKMYYSGRGIGAFVNGKRLRLSKVDRDFSKGFHAFCYGNGDEAKERAASYYRYMLAQGYQCRQLGAAQLELAYLAEGIIDTMFIASANVYDVAAGVLLVREAGGVVHNEHGTDWGYVSGSSVNQDVVAARNIENVQTLHSILHEKL